MYIAKISNKKHADKIMEKTCKKNKIYGKNRKSPNELSFYEN